MKTQTQYPTARQAAAQAQNTAPGQHENDFEQTSPEHIVEHSTVSGFVRRTPHRWHMVDITRFGTAVGKAADALQICYATTVDCKLGFVRIFPIPLLERVYEVTAEQFGWPSMIQAQTILPPRRTGKDLVKAHQRVGKHLEAVLEAAGDDEVKRSMGVVIDWLQRECAAMGNPVEG